MPSAIRKIVAFVVFFILTIMVSFIWGQQQVLRDPKWDQVKSLAQNDEVRAIVLATATPNEVAEKLNSMVKREQEDFLRARRWNLSWLVSNDPIQIGVAESTWTEKAMKVIQLRMRLQAQMSEDEQGAARALRQFTPCISEQNQACVRWEDPVVKGFLGNKYDAIQLTRVQGVPSTAEVTGRYLCDSPPSEGFEFGPVVIGLGNVNGILSVVATD